MTIFNSRKSSLVVLFALIVILFQVQVSESLTLKEAREEALIANLGIKSAHEKTIQSDELTSESYTKLFPTLSLLGQSTYASEEGGSVVERGVWGAFPILGPIPSKDSRVIAEDNNIAFMGSVRLQQPIFTGGRIWFNYQAMKSQYDESRWNEEQFIQEILLSTEKAYFALLKSLERSSIAKAHRVTVGEQMADMEKRQKHGRATLNDVLKMRVQLAEADSEVLKAKNSVLIAEGQVNLLLNRPLEKPVDAVPVGDPQQVTLTTAEAKELAKLANKALQSARQKRLTAEFQRRITEADYYPNITFTGQYNAQSGMANYREKWWFAGIAMEWNIWQWGGTKNKVNAAKAYERQTEYDVASLENKTVIDARDAYLLISEVDQRVHVSREAVMQAEENFRIVKIGYEKGRNTATELLKAEELLVEAKATLVQDTYEAHIARANLRFIIGKMEFLDFLTYRQLAPVEKDKPAAPESLPGKKPAASGATTGEDRAVALLDLPEETMLGQSSK